jgi:hypothetical protein
LLKAVKKNTKQIGGKVAVIISRKVIQRLFWKLFRSCFRSYLEVIFRSNGGSGNFGTMGFYK